MAITILPTKTDGSIGRVKKSSPLADGVAIDLDYFTTAAEFDALKDALVNVSASVGLTDGSTSGSIEQRLIGPTRRQQAIAAKSNGDNIKADEDILLVDTTSGSVTLGVDVLTYGKTYLIKKINTSTNKIAITPPTGWSIEAGATNAAVDLPDSNTGNRYAWTLIVNPAASKIWIA